MKIQYINVIETSALCNKKCSYCPHGGKIRRKIGLMTMETFKRAIYWVKYFWDKQKQNPTNIPKIVMDLNLHGIGEPLLNDNIVEMVEYATKTIPDVYLRMTTNCSLVTRDRLRDLLNAGLKNLDLTDHDPLETVNAMVLREHIGMTGMISRDFVLSSHNWAGQIKWTQYDYHPPCWNLDYGLAVVTWDGKIVLCCLDAHNNSVIGSIWDDNVPDIEINPGVLCNNCHHEKPAY